jgi:hypothetical protein
MFMLVLGSFFRLRHRVRDGRPKQCVLVVLGQALVAEKVFSSAFRFEKFRIRLNVFSSHVKNFRIRFSCKTFPSSAFSCETFSQSLQRLHLHAEMKIPSSAIGGEAFPHSLQL